MGNRSAHCSGFDGVEKALAVAILQAVNFRKIVDEHLAQDPKHGPMNCLRKSNPRVVVCHCATCKGKKS